MLPSSGLSAPSQLAARSAILIVAQPANLVNLPASPTAFSENISDSISQPHPDPYQELITQQRTQQRLPRLQGQQFSHLVSQVVVVELASSGTMSPLQCSLLIAILCK